MKVTTICLAIGLLLVASLGCNRVRETTSNAGPSKTSLSGTPEQANTGSTNKGFADSHADDAQDPFWTAAAAGGIAEVDAGQVDELKALAGKHNASLPTSPDGEHQAMLNQLKQMSGADFDRTYVAAMVKDHEATVQL